MFSVSGSTSASTGRAPTCSITFTEATNVIGVVTTWSPGPMPAVTRAVWRAAVQELSARAPGAPRAAANSVSNRLVFGPVVIQFERSVSTTSSISSAPMRGGEKARNSVRLARGEVTVIGRLLGPGAGETAAGHPPLRRSRAQAGGGLDAGAVTTSAEQLGQARRALPPSRD